MKAKTYETEGNRASVDVSRDKLIETLEQVLNDVDLPSRDRVSAVRTLAEMQGHLGKHQSAPVSAVAALSALTRPELEAELTRLRQHIAAQGKLKP